MNDLANKPKIDWLKIALLASCLVLFLIPICMFGYAGTIASWSVVSQHVTCLAFAWFCGRASRRRLLKYSLILLTFASQFGIAMKFGSARRDIFSFVPGLGLMSTVVFVIPLSIVIYKIAKRTVKVPPDEGPICSCGYNLTGNVSGRCPECGTSFDISKQAARSVKSKERRGEFSQE